MVLYPSFHMCLSFSSHNSVQTVIQVQVHFFFPTELNVCRARACLGSPSPPKNRHDHICLHSIPLRYHLRYPDIVILPFSYMIAYVATSAYSYISDVRYFVSGKAGYIICSLPFGSWYSCCSRPWFCCMIHCVEPYISSNGVCSILLRTDRSINEIHNLTALFSTKVFYKSMYWLITDIFYVYIFSIKLANSFENTYL
jgi:hypothetical protein